MNSKVSLSCILAIHQKNSFWKEAIESILTQDFEDFELIIVFNGSDFSFYEELKSIIHPKLVLLKTTIPQLSFNLNYAINIANGEYIARMDSDDLSMSDRFKKQIAYMKENNIDVMGSNYEIIDTQGNVTGKSKLPLSNKDIRRNLFFKNPICHPSVIFKKDIVLKEKAYLGGSQSEDYSLWLRLSRNTSVIFANHPEELIQYRIHNESQTKGQIIGYSESAGHLLTEFLITKKFSYFWGSLMRSIQTLLK